MRRKIIPLYEQVAAKIERHIHTAGLAPGEQVMSIREIRERYQVGDSTAKKAVRLLKKRGTVTTVVGGGIYLPSADAANNPSTTGPGVVALVKVGLYTAPTFAHEIDLVQQAVQEVGGVCLYMVAGSADDVPTLLARATAAGAQSLILFPSHGRDVDREPYVRDLLTSQLPVLLLESRSTKFNYVTADTEQRTEALVDHLCRLGHRRLCLATGFQRKVDGFKSALARWAGSQVTGTVLPEVGRSDADTRGLAASILAMSPRPTAVIAANDHDGAVLIDAFRDSGVAVPEALSVAVFDDHPRMARRSAIPMTVMRHPYEEVAQEAANWVRAQTGNLRGKHFRREITGSLIVRDTTAQPPQ